jgi:hypothetical protein
MARKLKTYQTSLGFLPGVGGAFGKSRPGSVGLDEQSFHQSFSEEVDDPDLIAATLSIPWVIGPVGSNGPLKKHAELPTDLSSDEAKGRTEKHRAKLGKKPSPKIDENAARRATLEFTKEQKRREAERRKEGAARTK